MIQQEIEKLSRIFGGGSIANLLTQFDNRLTREKDAVRQDLLEFIDQVDTVSDIGFKPVLCNLLSDTTCTAHHLKIARVWLIQNILLQIRDILGNALPYIPSLSRLCLQSRMFENNFLDTDYLNSAIAVEGFDSHSAYNIQNQTQTLEYFLKMYDAFRGHCAFSRCATGAIFRYAQKKSQFSLIDKLCVYMLKPRNIEDAAGTEPLNFFTVLNSLAVEDKRSLERCFAIVMRPDQDEKARIDACLQIAFFACRAAAQLPLPRGANLSRSQYRKRMVFKTFNQMAIEIAKCSPLNLRRFDRLFKDDVLQSKELYRPLHQFSGNTRFRDYGLISSISGRRDLIKVSQSFSLSKDIIKFLLVQQVVLTGSSVFLSSDNVRQVFRYLAEHRNWLGSIWQALTGKETASMRCVKHFQSTVLIRREITKLKGQLDVTTEEKEIQRIQNAQRKLTQKLGKTKSQMDKYLLSQAEKKSGFVFADQSMNANPEGYRFSHDYTSIVSASAA